MQERVHALLRMRETVAKKQKKIDWVQRLKAFLMNVFNFSNFFHAEGKMYSLGDVAVGWKGYGGMIIKIYHGFLEGKCGRIW